MDRSSKINKAVYKWQDKINKNDILAHEYLKLLQKFEDIPYCNEIIYNKLPFKKNNFEDQVFYLEDLESAEDEQSFSIEYETDDKKIYKILGNCLSNWNNILTCYIKQEDLKDAIRITYFIARCISHASIAFSEDEEEPLKIAHLKHTIQQGNLAIKEIKLLENTTTQKRSLRKVTTKLRTVIESGQQHLLTFINQH